MILKKKGVDPDRIPALMHFLGPDDPANDIDLEETDHPLLDEGKVPVFIDDGHGCLGFSSFCKLVSSKSYYNENGYVDFEIVIEIPDEVNIEIMEEGADPYEVRGKGFPCTVNQGKLLSKINKLLGNKKRPRDLRLNKASVTEKKVEQSDDDLVKQVVAKMRQRHESCADAGATMKYIQEVFGSRPQPRDIINRVMNEFCK